MDAYMFFQKKKSKFSNSSIYHERLLELRKAFDSGFVTQQGNLAANNVTTYKVDKKRKLTVKSIEINN